MTTKTDEDIEQMAEQLHDWYLEATDKDNAEYNYEAVVPYADLTEGQKIIDRYIAAKVLAFLAEKQAETLKQLMI